MGAYIFFRNNRVVGDISIFQARTQVRDPSADLISIIS